MNFSLLSEFVKTLNINSFDPNFVISLGDFNAKSNSWSVNYKTTEEGTILENLIFLYGMKKFISALTHILQLSSSCIDLIFVNQPNLITDSGVYPSLDQNCHHQFIFRKLTLKIEYPPPYACEVWNNGKTQTDLINRIIDHFDRVNLFLDKNINEQVILFHRTILNIFHNFIPNEIILCDGRNPPSMNERIKQLIKMKNVIPKNKKSQAQSTMSSKAISH